MKLLLISILTAIGVSGFSQIPHVSMGVIKQHKNFQSKFVASRNVDVWLPENYSKKRRYAVLYMHDGKALFDSSIMWNKQEWGVDEAVS